jgi:uncharacterized cupin superfamily protein
MPDLVRLTEPPEDAWAASAYVTPETLRAGDPQEREAVLHASEDGRFLVSLWEAQPYTEHIDGYPVDEYVRVVSGTLVLTTDGGEPETYGAGDEVRIPLGWSGTWEVTAPFRKLSVAYAPG